MDMKEYYNNLDNAGYYLFIFEDATIYELRQIFIHIIISHQSLNTYTRLV